MAGPTELGKRLRAALAVLALLAAGMLADLYILQTDLCLMLFGAVVLGFAFNEYCNLCEQRGTRTFRVLGICGSIGLLFLQWLTMPQGRTPVWDSYEKGRAVVDAALVVLVFGMFLRQAFIKDSSDALPAIGMTLLGVFYLWFLPGFLYRIRHLGGQDWLLTGHNLFLATVIVAKISDVGAYFGGRKFGRHKLIPRISPGKSIEGAVCGLASSVVAALLLRSLGMFPDRVGVAAALGFGVLVGGTGMCGDLVESMLKRSGGAKDSSRMLPGYGGVLDVVDSVIISAPPAYLFLRVVADLRMGA